MAMAAAAVVAVAGAAGAAAAVVPQLQGLRGSSAVLSSSKKLAASAPCVSSRRACAVTTRASPACGRRLTRCTATAPLPGAGEVAAVAAAAATVGKVVEALTPEDRPPPLDNKFIVMMQGFNWESCNQKTGWYKILEKCAKELGQMGVTDVWLPPPSRSVAKQGYLPTQLYNLNDSSYGNEKGLRSLINALHKNGVRAIADIVINHRCADFQDSRGVWSVFEGGTADERLDWGPWAIAKGDSFSDQTGNVDTGEDYGAAPDIDHTNERVQKDLIEWMNWMREDVGFDGWRLDFVKGYAGWIVKMYMDATKPHFVVGELWNSLVYDGSGLAYNQDGARQELCNWIDSTEGRSGAFDFPTKGILQEAVNNQYWRLRDQSGKPPGLIGWWPSKAVTFIDNHDTGSSQQHWPFPGDKVMAGYAYILTHPGVPCLFYDHVYDWGLKDQIKALVAVRKNNGLHAESKPHIYVSDADCYMACIDEKVVVKLGPRMDLGANTPDASWEAVAFGKDYCVWQKK